MTSLVSPELGRLLALCRVRRGHVVRFEHDLFVDHGRRIPDYIRAHLRELLDDGYLCLGDDRAEWGQWTVLTTTAGE